MTDQLGDLLTCCFLFHLCGVFLANLMSILQEGAALDGAAAVFGAQRVHGLVQLL